MFVNKSDFGKRYVISDIHGCFNTFKALIDKISLNKTDLLFLLGDYIDRGHNSSGVINYILELQNSGYNIFPLRGNHENNILETQITYDSLMFGNFVRKINKSPDLLEEDNSIKPEFQSFFESLPYYYELDNYILVHAGLNFKLQNPFEDKTSMLELRGFSVNVPANFSKTIIHGHNPTYLSDIMTAINERQKVIPLDNGCVYSKPHKFYDYKQLGKLLCFDLDNFEIIYQTNIE